MPSGREIWLAPCEMPAGVRGFISFHFPRKRKISQARQRLFHILRQQNISPKLFPSVRIYLSKTQIHFFVLHWQKWTAILTDGGFLRYRNLKGGFERRHLRRGFSAEERIHLPPPSKTYPNLLPNGNGFGFLVLECYTLRYYAAGSAIMSKPSELSPRQFSDSSVVRYSFAISLSTKPDLTNNSIQYSVS